MKNNDKLQKMYRLYGMAAHHGCNIECRIVELLLGPEWNERNLSSPEEVENVYADLYSLTLEQLLKKYKDHVEFTDEQLAVIDEVQTKRNYLDHRFFGMYDKRINDPDVVEEMIAELEDLIAYFESVDLE